MKPITVRCPDCKKFWKVKKLATGQRSIACPKCQAMVSLSHQVKAQKPTVAASDIAFWSGLAGVGVLAAGLVIGFTVVESSHASHTNKPAKLVAARPQPPKEIHNPNPVLVEQVLAMNRRAMPPADNHQPNVVPVEMAPAQPRANNADVGVPVEQNPPPAAPVQPASDPNLRNRPSQPSLPDVTISSAGIISRKSGPATVYSQDPDVIAAQIKKNTFDPRRFANSLDQRTPAAGFSSLSSRRRR